MERSGLSVSALACDRDEGYAVVSLTGRADIAHVAWFRQLLELSEAYGTGRLILDLSRVSSIDWLAVLMLLWTGRMVSRHGGTLVLASPRPAVTRLLKALDAAQAIAVYRSVQQAYDQP